MLKLSPASKKDWPCFFRGFSTRLAVFLILAVFILAQGANAEELKPKAFVPETVWDFGEITREKSVSHNFNIINQGNGILLLGRMYSLCSCSTITSSSTMLLPGDKADIIIEYHPQEQPQGNFSKDFYVESNDPDQKEIRFNINGRIGGNVDISDTVSRLRRLTVSEKGYQEMHLAYFYTPGCKKCEKVNRILNGLKKKYANMRIRKFNMDSRENRILCEAIARYYNVAEDKPLVSPLIFIDEAFLSGDEIEDKLDEVLVSYNTAASAAAPWKTVKIESGAISQTIVQRFKSFGPMVILGAGFIDGINPCAFTTIVFFISFLALRGYRRREMVLTGVSFITAIFLAYILIGLGIFKFLQEMEAYSFLSRVLYIGIALLAIGLGLLSLYDYWIYRTTSSVEKMKLQLPKVLKNLIHKVIRNEIASGVGLEGSPRNDKRSNDRGVDVVKLGSSAFIAGFIVSLLESVCTGQVYLPTILFVMSEDALRPKAFLYLLVYNLMFIAPLMLIFLFALKGATSEKFASFARRHLGTVKVITACLFFGLGALLLMIR